MPGSMLKSGLKRITPLAGSKVYDPATFTSSLTNAPETRRGVGVAGGGEVGVGGSGVDVGGGAVAVGWIVGVDGAVVAVAASVGGAEVEVAGGASGVAGTSVTATLGAVADGATLAVSDSAAGAAQAVRLRSKMRVKIRRIGGLAPCFRRCSAG